MSEQTSDTYEEVGLGDPLARRDMLMRDICNAVESFIRDRHRTGCDDTSLDSWQRVEVLSREWGRLR